MRSFILLEVEHDSNSSVEHFVKDFYSGVHEYDFGVVGVRTKGPLREAEASAPGHWGYTIPAESLDTVVIYEP